jgi:predicted nuclease with TOPRIM domain
MNFRYVTGPNRYLCSVFDEMRKCCKTLNFSYLESLIEEAQVLGNRMEAALEDVDDIKRLHEEKKKLKRELQALEDKINELKPGEKED